MVISKEVKGVREYLRYIETRVRLLKLGALSVEDNQALYYCELFNVIKQWGGNHRLIYKYLINKLSFNHVQMILGYSGKESSRFIKRQVIRFIEFLQNQETLLFLKYPFIERCEIEKLELDNEGIPN